MTLSFAALEKNIQEIQSLAQALKHYPGQHNQANHGNRYGHASSSFETMNNDQRHTLLQKTYDDWVKNLDLKEHNAIGQYTGSSYMNINEILRTPDQVDSFNKNYYAPIIENATSGLQKGKLPFPITVKRGMVFFLDDDGSNKDLDTYLGEMKANIGKTFTDPAFVSTTIYDTPTFGGSDDRHVNLTIHVPKGTDGAYVHDISYHPHEGEFLFPPKTRFKVTKVEGNNIELAVLKPGKTKKEFFSEERKHYPGLHDQANHGNRFGKGSNDALSGKTLGQKDDVMTNAFKDWPKSLSSEEKEAIRQYTGSGFKGMNAVLRNNLSESDIVKKIKENIALVESGLQKGSLPFAVTVSRGIGFLDEDDGKKFVSELIANKGKVFTDKGFVSTTLQDKSDFGMGRPVAVQMKIHLPKGMKGAYVEPISINDGEFEFLLPHGMQFKVLKAQDLSNGDYAIELAALKPGKKKDMFDQSKEFKHYPGMHDQANHGNRYGNSSSVSPSFSALTTLEKHAKLKMLYEKWGQSLTHDELNSIQEYTGMIYSDMNTLLRHPDEASEHDKAIYGPYIQHATSGLEKGETPFAFSVKRGLTFTKDGLSAYLDEMRAGVGKTFIDPAFVSTTINKNNIFEENPYTATVTIHLPKGTKGAYVGGISNFPQEREFLLPPKTRFKVLKVEGNIIELSVAKPGKTQKMYFDRLEKHTQEIQSLLEAVKHYPGQHDQSTHGRRYGSPTSTSSSFTSLSNYGRHDLMIKSYTDWKNNLTREERSAIVEYTGFSYHAINSVLRNPHSSDSTKDYYQSTIENATSGLNKGATPMAITVTRGMSFHPGEIDNYLNEMKANIGKTFVDPAFTSTTIEAHPQFSSTGENAVNVIIHVPKGAKGAYVDSMSLNEGEREFLLPPKTRFKVLKVYKDSAGNNKIELAMAKSGKTKKEIYNKEYTESLFESTKHYPGQHNQANHGNRYGSASSVSSSYNTLSDAGRAVKLTEAYADWQKNLTSEEYDSIRQYTGGSYSIINAMLRHPDKTDKHTKNYYQEIIDHATSGLEKGKLPFAITVKRGLGFSASDFDSYMNGMKVNIGKTFTDSAFVSTTTQNNPSFGMFSQKSVNVTIHVPKGAKGAYVKSLSYHGGEDEFLFPPKTRFKVTKVEGNSIELSVLKPGKTKNTF